MLRLLLSAANQHVCDNIRLCCCMLCPAGTIEYMPSELLLMGRMTTATDIYSFGLMSEWAWLHHHEVTPDLVPCQTMTTTLPLGFLCNSGNVGAANVAPL
jgi:serine/threonine protein kinase